MIFLCFIFSFLSFISSMVFPIWLSWTNPFCNNRPRAANLGQVDRHLTTNRLLALGVGRRPRAGCPLTHSPGGGETRRSAKEQLLFSLSSFRSPSTTGAGLVCPGGLGKQSKKHRLATLPLPHSAASTCRVHRVTSPGRYHLGTSPVSFFFPLTQSSARGRIACFFTSFSPLSIVCFVFFWLCLAALTLSARAPNNLEDCPLCLACSFDPS